MKIIIIFLLVSLFVLGCFYFIYSSDSKGVTQEVSKKLYQGPVPVGYDLEHFRKTGEMRKKIMIIDPKTGEQWESIEDFKSRNKKGVSE